ncbi:uncharacterized protein LOC115884671 [Sitophilus oryzae]|uniref:Uncharacterized protein LOC115884671 n=1 Tax=Sitophilus oryzae TaxID=7048 RepID=A0A6J2Y5S6_SITOR|nr:uncharacterized protein LOC115884671 [Sitophilus oryzae]
MTKTKVNGKNSSLNNNSPSSSIIISKRITRSSIKNKELKVHLNRLQININQTQSSSNISKELRVILEPLNFNLHHLTPLTVNLTRLEDTPNVSQLTPIKTRNWSNNLRRVKNKNKNILASSQQNPPLQNLRININRLPDINQQTQHDPIIEQQPLQNLRIILNRLPEIPQPTNVTNEPPRRAPVITPQRLTWQQRMALNNINRNVRPTRSYRDGITVSAAEVEEICANRVHNLGPMDITCLHCGAMFFPIERHAVKGVRSWTCCKGGKIVLPPLRPIPAELIELFTGEGEWSNQFRDKIRFINGLLAMASFKTSVPGDAENQTGRCFAISGQIFHFTNPLPNTQDLTAPRLNQFYFIDVGEAIAKRGTYIEGQVDRTLVDKIERVLRRVNRYINAYKTMAEVIREIRTESRTSGRGDILNDVVLAFCDNINEKRRTHHLPESRSDIAALFIGEDPPFDVELKIYPRVSNITSAQPLRTPRPTDSVQTELDEETLEELFQSQSQTRPPRTIQHHHQLKNLNKIADPIFERKLKEFLRGFTDHQLYGRVLNYHLIVEFQKRGLSHSHIVFTFVQDDKIHHERVVDALISACINFIISLNQRSKYHRPNNSRIVLLANETLPIDNRHVVPYNSYALAKYNCHINFEVVGAAAIIKYLHKHLMKGWDRVYIDVNDKNNRVNEIHRYIECRYVSSTKAA